MAITIKQAAEYKGADRWSWSVWIDGPTEEIDTVESVTYHLHRTFANPIVTRKNRKNNFRLNASGWGEFEIVAEIKVKGDEEPLTRGHWLKFAYPHDAATAGEKERPRSVFVSYSAVDAQALPAVRAALGQIDAEIVHSGSLGDAGTDVDKAVERAVRESAALVAVLSDKTSSWVEMEIALARKFKVPVVPVVIGKAAHIPESLADVHAIQVETTGDLQHAVGELAESIRILIKRAKR